MPTKKAVKKIDADDSKREAFRLYEEVNDFFLAHALEGDFPIEDMTRAKAAFDVMDVDTLRELCGTWECELDFIEPDEALKAYLPRMKPVKLEKSSKLDGGRTRKFTMADYSQHDRCNILTTIPGTRAYARAQIEAQGGGTPFDD